MCVCVWYLTWYGAVRGAWQQQMEVLSVSSLVLKPRLQHRFQGEHTVLHPLQVDLRPQHQTLYRHMGVLISGHRWSRRGTRKSIRHSDLCRHETAHAPSNPFILTFQVYFHMYNTFSDDSHISQLLCGEKQTLQQLSFLTTRWRQHSVGFNRLICACCLGDWRLFELVDIWGLQCLWIIHRLS